MQSDYLRLETVGRKTGKPHQVLLRYVTIEDRILIFPSGRVNQAWFLNLKHSPKVRAYKEGTILEGTAEIRKVSNAALEALKRKYDRRIVKEYYGEPEYYAEIQVVERRSGSSDDIFYGDLETAFNQVAQVYDSQITSNPISLWLRKVSVGFLKEIFKPGDVILEIGCGTGAETIQIAKHGVTVIALDISSKMLEILKEKAKRAGLSDNIIPIHSRPADLSQKISKLGFGLLDGAFSTYGAVNSEPHLDKLFQMLHNLLKKDAHLLIGSWNRYCLVEILGYNLWLKPKLAFARMRNPVSIDVSRFCVATNAFSVRSLGKFASPYFNLKKVQGIPVLLPPWNLARYLPRETRFELIKKIDLRLGSVFPFNRLGDYFLVLYSKN